MDGDQVFRKAAQQQGIALDVADRILAHYRETIGYDSFYAYRIESPKLEGTSNASAANQRKRTLLVFRTGDDALSFAQRNRLGPTPRLLRLSLAHILATLLHRPALEAVLFVTIVDDHIKPGQYPDGIRVQRSHLLEALQA